MKRLLIIVLTITVVLFAGLLGWGFLNGKLNKIQKDNRDYSSTAKENQALTAEGYTNLLIFGLDNRQGGDYGNGRSDSMMLLSIQNETKEVKLLSLYRDTYLNINYDDYGKLNAAYSIGGASTAIAAINRNFDLAVEDYVAVDFVALRDLVDLLGGLDLSLTQDELEWFNIYIDSLNWDLGTNVENIWEPGDYHMNGTQALAYCRIRYTAGDDYKRTFRQRLVLNKMYEKLKESDLVTVNAILDQILPEIRTSLSNQEILSLAAGIFDYELVDTAGFPFSVRNGQIEGSDLGDLVIPCTLEYNAGKLHEFLFTEENYSPSHTVKGISSQIMQDSGFDVSDAVDYGFGLE